MATPPRYSPDAVVSSLRDEAAYQNFIESVRRKWAEKTKRPIVDGEAKPTGDIDTSAAGFAAYGRAEERNIRPQDHAAYVKKLRDDGPRKPKFLPNSPHFHTCDPSEKVNFTSLWHAPAAAGADVSETEPMGGYESPTSVRDVDSRSSVSLEEEAGRDRSPARTASRDAPIEINSDDDSPARTDLQPQVNPAMPAPDYLQPLSSDTTRVGNYVNCPS